ncbi:MULTISPECIES: hypothetical protein [Sphingobacterium]|uniref:Uncharacterized protein n=1 Tax=Sphingobacterium ginsenosidimutans TaxID=687845 RepID=A0ABP8A7Z5_9SPHI|nr:hypothetical protein [Sphingobacterium sp. E70]ULT25415.1 hypothetical protein KUH03_42705 [Sphingobacterium sp. E70]
MIFNIDRWIRNINKGTARFVKSDDDVESCLLLLNGKDVTPFMANGKDDVLLIGDGGINFVVLLFGSKDVMTNT